MIRPATEFRGFYEGEHASFARLRRKDAPRADVRFLEYVTLQAIALDPDTKAADKAYENHFRTLRMSLGQILGGAQRLAAYMDHVNGQTGGGMFKQSWLAAVRGVEAHAQKVHRDLALKRPHGGQPRQLRRHYFRAAIETYLKWKGLSDFATEHWWDQWAIRLDGIAVKDCGHLKTLERRGGIRPDDLVDGFISESYQRRKLRTQAWWWKKPRSPIVARALVQGAESYLYWARGLHSVGRKEGLAKAGKPLSPQERSYATVALKFLESRGIGKKDVRAAGAVILGQAT